MKKFLFALPALFLLPGLAFALDFGLLADQKFEAEGKVLFYNSSLAPWFSWTGDRGLSLYLSGALSFKYSHYDDGIGSNDGWAKPALLPELSRFALQYRPGRNFRIEAGRFAYSDTLGFAASGLFDGLRLEADLAFGSVALGAWYTGFLYRESAKITMTALDMKNYAEPWDWDRFGAYFASRRALASFRWDLPLPGFHTLSLEALAQFDLNNDEGLPPGEARLHTQYGEIQAELFPSGRLGLGAGALFEAMENGAGEFAAALGGLLRLKADLPGSLSDSLTATVKFGSGRWNDTFAAFAPLSSFAQGAIFPGTLSGLGLFSADYAARPHRALLLETALRYFARTWDDPAAPGKYFYGGEFWASLAWQPLDDLRVSLGGGAFFPVLGTINPGGDPQWKLNAGLTLSF
ncbi:MAG: hypothetical protein LBI91_05765 [Spirochaetaceae bacterium]|jgi:hypothetical protein|nr:hypothetical protein [Spirochaetaceae bacterium]